MKTFKVTLYGGAIEMIDADEHKVSAGALCLYRLLPPKRASSRLRDKELIIAYGPMAWSSFQADPTLTGEGQRVSVDVLNATNDLLGRAMRFLSPIANADQLIDSETIKLARTLKTEMSDTIRKLAPFTSDEDEEEDEDEDD